MNIPRFSSPAELMGYINDPKNYKRASKKQYEIWCCMPEVGTNVHNHLENADYVTNEQKKFVLSGTVGEQWVIDIGKLMKTYTFVDGMEINPDTLRRKLVSGSKTIGWFKVKTRPDVTPGWACFVPVQYQFPIATSWGDTLTGNRPGVQHGYGDFIVCTDAGGQPNGNDRWIVNGAIFVNTYDNRGWTEVLQKGAVNGELQKPRELTAHTASNRQEQHKGGSRSNGMVNYTGAVMAERLNKNYRLLGNEGNPIEILNDILENTGSDEQDAMAKTAELFKRAFKSLVSHPGFKTSSTNYTYELNPMDREIRLDLAADMHKFRGKSMSNFFASLSFYIDRDEPHLCAFSAITTDEGEEFQSSSELQLDWNNMRTGCTKPEKYLAYLQNWIKERLVECKTAELY